MSKADKSKQPVHIWCPVDRDGGVYSFYAERTKKACKTWIRTHDYFRGCTPKRFRLVPVQGARK